MEGSGGSPESYPMLKRARISLLVALVAATLGFLGFVDIVVAQLFFYLPLAFAVLSFVLGMFDAEVDPEARRRGSGSAGSLRRKPQAVRLEQ